MTITPPAFQKNAVPSLKGWHHPKTNELLKSTRHTQSQLDEFNGVMPVQEVVNIKEVVPVCEHCDEDGNCTCDDIPEEINSMTKKELEIFAKEKFDVDLDRRKGKRTLLNQVTKLFKR